MSIQISGDIHALAHAKDEYFNLTALTFIISEAKCWIGRETWRPLFVYFYSALPFTKSSFKKGWIEAGRGTRKCEDGHMTGEF